MTNRATSGRYEGSRRPGAISSPHPTDTRDRCAVGVFTREKGWIAVSAPRLGKGQNQPLPPHTRRITVAIGWTDPHIDVDASALLLGSGGKVGADSDFIFFNQPASPDGTVRFLGITPTDDDSVQARISIDLARLSDSVASIAVVASLESRRFTELGDLTLTFADEHNRVLAEYITSDATTETALFCGEVYRRGDGWKIRAVGQGWDSGLAGLATDFGVNIDDDIDHERTDETVRHEVGDRYRLWTQARTFCDYELTIEPPLLPALRSLFPQDFLTDGEELRPIVELVPEPDGDRGEWAVSVRADGRTVGYLNDEDAPRWAGVLRRIVSSGFVPTTTSRIWAREYDGFDGIEFSAYMHIALGDPDEALPLNEPPAVPYTMLPRSSIIQVTKEDDHFDVLRKYVPDKGYGLLFATLHENTAATNKAKPHVEVRLDEKRIGQLTPQMSQRFLPMLRHLNQRALVAACWADITGSAVAAKVRIDAVKANEATDDVLNGPPATIPILRATMPDPYDYDLTALRPKLQPLPPIPPPPPPPIPAEPADGSVVRFTKGRRYNYIAVRRGNRWETTATQDWGVIDEVMSWPRLAARVREFEIATAWEPIKPHGDHRTREYLAVVRFTIHRQYIAAINIRTDGRPDGDWYTTITDDAEQNLPFGDYAEWSDIAASGQHLQLATAWAPLS
ncbi:TerD family protein [Nocardia otitidiscaviarum]|uniref:TerD family protein n=1 Tax=Nocardia otitidiscaviarum TaxID=1823 RepID=UPI00163D6843|nr:TerD family protein [Nocardia otitidiscaviarum]MCP9624834.1 TerD family protein [Nocardia otitidiscaviarum]